MPEPSSQQQQQDVRPAAQQRNLLLTVSAPCQFPEKLRTLLSLESARTIPQVRGMQDRSPEVLEVEFVTASGKSVFLSFKSNHSTDLITIGVHTHGVEMEFEPGWFSIGACREDQLISAISNYFLRGQL